MIPKFRPRPYCVHKYYDQGRIVGCGDEISDLFNHMPLFFAFSKTPCKLTAFEDILTNRY
jgi:hypothetical protein